MSAVFPTAESMVNRARYPIDTPESEVGTAQLKDCRQEFESAGLCVLPEFILTDALAALAEEATGVLDARPIVELVDIRESVDLNC